MAEDPLDPSLVDKYQETLVEIHFGDRLLSHEQFYEIFGETFYMITAANPFSRLLSEEENRLRNQELGTDLHLLGLAMYLGIGRDPLSAWFEEGWVVTGISEPALVELAQKYEQNAFFKFDNFGQHIVICR